MDNYDNLIVTPGTKVRLKHYSTAPSRFKMDKSQVQIQLIQNQKRLFDLQYQLYAEGTQSVLIVLQALDAAGKDGVINHVLSAMNPQGCHCKSFKTPSALECAHDFLWRIHKEAPARGEIVIFNRSHYEDVLVARVHKLVDKDTWEHRYEQINAFEQLLESNGTKILKFFLYIDREEQLKRFGERLEDPEKHWKISESDYSERALWKEYIAAFEEAITKCNTKSAPWFIIPSNDKDFRNLAVSEILIDTLTRMKIKMPRPKANIEEIRKLYLSELDHFKKK